MATSHSYSTVPGTSLLFYLLWTHASWSRVDACSVCHYIWKIPPSAYKTFASAFCSSLQQTFPDTATPELIEAWRALILHASHKMDKAFNYTKGLRSHLRSRLSLIGDSFQVSVFKGKWKPTTLVVHTDSIVYSMLRSWIIRVQCLRCRQRSEEGFIEKGLGDWWHHQS